MTLATDQNSSWEDFSPTARRFIALRDAVMDYWEAQVRERIRGAGELLSPVLTNTLPAFYDNIAEALSPAHPRKDATSNTNAAAVHGDERARMTPFRPDQVIHEYQIFRQAIGVVTKSQFELSEHEWTVIDHSIDAAMRESIRAFSASQETLRHKLAAALSHDMRTPLGVIANGAQFIGIARDLDVETARQVAAKIESNASRLNAMMSELLDALTQQTKPVSPLRLTEFDINALVTEARNQYCHLPDCSVTIEPNDGAIIGYWCLNSLRRALENLVNNAIKYGSGKIITIKACATRGRLMLSVHNDGNPIPRELHTGIFDYLRREADVTAGPGWGIGLQYVKSVAEGHGGSAVVDSSAQTGTTFMIDIPVDCRPYVVDPSNRSLMLP